MVTWELGAMAVKSTPSVPLQEPSVVAVAASIWTLQHVKARHCWPHGQVQATGQSALAATNKVVKENMLAPQKSH